MSEANKSAGKWAPWYIYAILIAGANFIKQEMLAGVVPVWVNAVATVALVGLILFVVTAVHRSRLSAKQHQ